jgi:hypothetical protein
MLSSHGQQKPEDELLSVCRNLRQEGSPQKSVNLAAIDKFGERNQQF